MTVPTIACPGADWERSPRGLLLPPRPGPPSARRYGRPVAVELFAGAGGMSLGFHQAGWHVAAASEMDIPAALTYMVNLARPGVRIYSDDDKILQQFEAATSKHLGLTPPGKGDRASASAPRKRVGEVIEPGLRAGEGWIAGEPDDHPGCEAFFLADVRNLTGKMILDAIGMDVGEVDAVIGGPPCQGFSTAGKRDVMDPRNSLVFEFARLVLEIRPKTMLLENVPNILNMVTPEGVPVVDALCRVLEDGGWGAYDALRKSLAAMGGQGLGGAIRQKKGDPRKSKQRKAKKRAQSELDAEGSLFAEDGES